LGAHPLAATHKRCPLCAEPLLRMHRTSVDRMISMVVPVHRYRCYNLSCNWEGVLQVAPALVGGPNPLARLRVPHH
jgi:hypothetical protein